ncbi:hypothetical protein A1O7_07244 [Cladophialophora yegresii CBS 114405]|uniref:Uncharacterized protein n=1 Tax=Cladophialophora yegresii CBS 114405 TaxID=1182544 RepID=W9VW43_9EURO|nr:uncharacterized protein A1O7_07244 [Cladophialophora yegresii CBS 114405]EXJ56900.1 hypothetical protein A1O7_07244 [Cladophialophora yegresii CBS 114405]
MFPGTPRRNHRWVLFLTLIKRGRHQAASVDKFTTDYYLPDGSYGSIISGNYTTPDGGQANLITGDYQLANGQRGNIYRADSLDEPNTPSLPIPTPWTSSGVGSAIPASQVGSQAFANTSATPSWPILTTTGVTSTGTLLTSLTNASATRAASSLVHNITVLSGGPTVATSSSTPAASSTGPPQPEITPPIPSAAVMWKCGGIYSLWLLAVVSHMVMI